MIAYVKLRLRDFLQEWNSNLENSSKALNYRLYKRIFEFENSFNILENKYIFTFCKFRTTYTKLPIETGRWNNIAIIHWTQKKTTTYDDGNPGPSMWQAQKCGRAKPVPDPPVSKLKNIHVILILLLLFEKNWVIFPFSNQLTIFTFKMNCFFF